MHTVSAIRVVVVALSFLFAVQSASGQSNAAANASEARMAALERDVAKLRTVIGLVRNGNLVVTTENGITTLRFSGINVQIVNGAGTTEAANGTGNLIIGYNESPDVQDPTDRTGSHYLVVGRGHRYSQWGGMVVGDFNTARGRFASVSGRFNVANADYSSVSGGYSNSASGIYSSVSGGANNSASNSFSTVSGGIGNFAFGVASSAFGGHENLASGASSSVSGGTWNVASGTYSSVSGGFENKASGQYSSVSGGHGHAAPGQFNWTAGDAFFSAQ